ncbi:MAG: c-di-GMP-binding flagellar brake protein YcgR [Candidatus Endobugula sp.]|jgi:c-di-GMP-binding flagellar brake protein YcgR
MGLFNHFIDRLTHTEVEPIVNQQAIEHRLLEHYDNYNHLLKLQAARQLVEVLLNNRKNSFQSMIINIDLINDSFGLDAFSPTLLAPESLIGQDITIRHQHQWKKLEINTSIIDWSVVDQCYRLNLPEFADYQPRRNYPRLLLDNNNLLKTHINPLYGAPWYATVKDISQGGMRINIPGDLRQHLHKDKLLPQCQVILDEDITVKCRGVVRAFTYVSKPYRHTEISIEFHNMNHFHQTDLKRFIDYIEVAAA